MHTVFALLCFVVVIYWLIFPYPSGLLHWHCGNLTIAPVPAKQPWWIWINTSCEFIMNDCVTTTKQSTTKPCAYFLGYTVGRHTYKQHYWSKPRFHVSNMRDIAGMLILKKLTWFSVFYAILMPHLLKSLFAVVSGIARNIHMNYWSAYIQYISQNIMMTPSNWNIFHVTVPSWGEFLVTGGFPSQRPMTRSFDVINYLRPNKRLNKQSRHRWLRRKRAHGVTVMIQEISETESKEILKTVCGNIDSHVMKSLVML